MPDSLAPYGWDDRVAALVAAADRPDTDPGRVTRVDRDRVDVVTAHGVIGATGHPLPAVGDWVLLDPVAGGGITSIVEILPAWSRLERHAATGATAVQVLAADIDLVLVVASLDHDVRSSRLDRELVVAWASGARPVVVLTKADVHPDPDAAVAEVADRTVGVDVIATSIRDGRGIAELRALIGPSDTVVLLGASGVGKSSLGNLLLDGDVLATGSVRAADRKGRHTTTTRDLVPIPGGGMLIDTPGLRSLGLWEAAGGLSLAFSDIEELAVGCRFADCAHDQEPGCAVAAAAIAGTVSAARVESWRKLQREAAFVARNRDARARADRSREQSAVHRALRRRPAPRR